MKAYFTLLCRPTTHEQSHPYQDQISKQLQASPTNSTDLLAVVTQMTKDFQRYLQEALCLPAEATGKRENDEISDRDMAVIARDHLVDWENLHSFLGLSRVQKREIANSYPTDYRKQKQKCLEIWREVNGAEATYAALISAAEEAKDKDLADSVRSLLKKSKN